MSLKISTVETVDVDVNGEVFKVKSPSLKKLGELDATSQKMVASELPAYYESYFEEFGLPSRVSQEFTVKNWKSFIEEIAGSKKV